MRKVKAAAVQMSCSWDIDENIKKADKFVAEAADKGANIVLLQELFQTPYFCQQEKVEFFSLATTLEEDKAVNHFKKVCKERNIVVPVSFFERCNQAYYNTVAVINADGTVLGTYRKSHIPTGPQYEEKLYFSPGDTGFKVWKTKFGTIGVGICWDQYFIEQARIMALMGAEILMYPTATGADPYVQGSCKTPWQNVMKGHAASNMVPVIASNRVGTERIEGTCGSSSLDFFGASFITDERGEIAAEADDHSECCIMAEFDLDELKNKRAAYGMFRDRRIDLYDDLLKDSAFNGGRICEK